jgi:hypothetical protein
MSADILDAAVGVGVGVATADVLGQSDELSTIWFAGGTPAYSTPVTAASASTVRPTAMP